MNCPPQLGAGTDALTAAVFMLRSSSRGTSPVQAGLAYRMYWRRPALFSERLADLEMLLIAAKEQQADSAPLLGFPGRIPAAAAKKSPMKAKAASPAFVSPSVAGAAAALSNAASARARHRRAIMAGAEGARVAQCAAAPPQPSAAAAAALPASSAAAAAALAGAAARLAAAPAPPPRPAPPPPPSPPASPPGRRC